MVLLLSTVGTANSIDSDQSDLGQFCFAQTCHKTLDEESEDLILSSV